MHFYWGEHSYSNYGYQLLAVIVGKHSLYKTPTTTPLEAFRAHIENEVFKPAGMTGSPAPQRKIDCFEIAEEGTPVYDRSPAPYPHGNGCWSLTAKDLLAFERTHMSPLTSDPAIGFFEDRDENDSLMGRGHPGGGPGMSSFLHRWEGRSLTIGGLFNYSHCEMTKPAIDELFQ
jgi:CubicO group peptidase (beta-lactamase class C family)